MKNIFKIFIALTLIFNVSCDNEDDSNYGEYYNSGWVEVDGNEFEDTINYDNGTYSIPLLLNAGTNSNGLEVTYNVTLESGDVDTSVLGNKTTMISMTEKEGIITFDPVHNPDSYYTLKFTLVSTDDSEFSVGLSDDSQPIEFTLTVTNKKMYDATVLAFGANAPAYETLVGKIDANTYDVDSLWGPNFVAWATGNANYANNFLNSGNLIVDASNNLTVNGDYVADTGSTGTFDSTTGVFNYTFNEDGLFNAGFAINTILTPQE